MNNNKITFGTLQSKSSSTDSLQVAAAAVSLNIPFLPDRFITTAHGDGLKKIRAVFNFSGKSPDGNSIQMLSNAWTDKKWLDANPKSEVAIIKKAFKAMFDLADQAKGTSHLYQPCERRDTIYTASTAAAATLIAIGHPCYGYTKFSGSLFWHFDRAATSDIALWNDKNIHERLPDHIVSYVKCALLNWKTLLTEVNSRPEFTAVKHKNRTAFVPRSADEKEQINLEKLLYRK